MTPIDKYFAANFHLYSFLPELTGTLRQCTSLTVLISQQVKILGQFWYVPVLPELTILVHLKYQNYSDNSGKLLKLFAENNSGMY